MTDHPPMVRHWQVGITYCDGKVLIEDFGPEKAVKTVVERYAQVLAEALQPSVTDVQHIRMITLIGYNDANLVVHHIHSGVIGCTHR